MRWPYGHVTIVASGVFFRGPGLFGLAKPYLLGTHFAHDLNNTT